MTPEEALNLLKRSDPEFAMSSCRKCVDFGGFYIFHLEPVERDGEDAFLTGTVFPRVDKDTGRVSEYDITEDVDAYLEAKPVEVEDFWDMRVSDFEK